MTEMRLANGELVNVYQNDIHHSCLPKNRADIPYVLLDIDPSITDLDINYRANVDVKLKKWPHFFILNTDETTSITEAEYNRLPEEETANYHIKRCIEVEVKTLCPFMAAADTSKKWYVYEDFIEFGVEIYCKIGAKMPPYERYMHEYEEGNPTFRFFEEAILMAQKPNKPSPIARIISDNRGWVC